MCRLFFGLLTLGLTLSLTAAASPAGDIVIGWHGPLSGPCAVVGVDVIPTLQIAADEINEQGGIGGRKVTIIAEDDQYQTTKALSSYKKLVHADRAAVVLTATYGGIFATAQDALKDGVLVVDTLDCNDKIAALPRNTLCIATQSESIAAGFAADIVEKKITSVLLLVEENDGWLQLISSATITLLKNAGVATIEESTPPSESEYTQPLLRARARGVQSIIFLGNDQMGVAMAKARTLGMKGQFYGTGSLLSPGFQQLAGDAVEGALVSSWIAPRDRPYQQFLKKFQAKVGRDPLLELAIIPTYDAAKIIVGCLKQQTGGDSNVDTLRQCILATKGYRGLSGELSFDPDGAVRSIKERLFRIKNRKLDLF